MQWSEAVKAPTRPMLRQFAAVWIVVFGGLAAWRAWGGVVDAWTIGLAVGAVVIGGAGLALPAVIRPVFTGWMIAVFPIGWIVSNVILAVIFYLVFTPIALVFRIAGRDVLGRRRRTQASYWAAKDAATSDDQYLRQS
jgi:hypothetical protein